MVIALETAKKQTAIEPTDDHSEGTTQEAFFHARYKACS